MRNCFTCPECSSNLSISLTDHEENGKSFRFNCVYCEWGYVTDVVYKPKSLHYILRDEMEKDPDGFQKLCGEIKKGVLNSENFEFRKSRDESDDQIRKNLELMMKKSADVEQRQEEEELEVEPIKKYPIAKKLTTKKTIRCLDCNTILQSQTPTSPTINKYTVKFNAIDYLPNIHISNLFNHPEKLLTKSIKYWKSTQILLLHFINPMTTKMHLNISIPSTFEINGTVSVSSTIPKNEFTLGPTIPNLIKTIPTALLNINNPIGKSELILRKGDVLYKPPPGNDEIEENLNEYIERGINWCSVPIIIKLSNKQEGTGGDKVFNLRLPVIGML
ncbi:uncharacterized protein J8A68_002633 [[Candida] subhashii]|uniref:Dynactin subunit 4 n=1 Tax=[Candida] subhashii TaxID=561895 RepID=A0A8J5QNZ6_9ASCO|nr:uncharacterized protein J8A68_002633 [[Candida] subhashii]KAG7663773.1 hypothetical protein J8A68_002633 [[Candida] subhashii]